jgi:hypothetical protein
MLFGREGGGEVYPQKYQAFSKSHGVLRHKTVIEEQCLETKRNFVA